MARGEGLANTFLNVAKQVIQKSREDIGVILREIEDMQVILLPPDDPRADMIEQTVSNAVQLSDTSKKILRKILILGVDAIYKPGEPLSHTDIAQHAIPLLDESQAVFVKDRPMTRSEIETAVKLIGALVDKHVLRKTAHGSSFNCPPKIVAKKTPGKFRLVSTFVRLNKATAHIPLFPMNRIDDIMATVNSMSVFSTIDFQDGYFQIKMKESDAHKTAFFIPNVGQFEYARMSQGLSGAPSTFNFVINEAMQHLKEIHVDRRRASLCSLFVDDLLVASNDNAVHLFHIHQVLQQLIRCKLKISGEKLELFQTSVQYCGKTVDKDGIGPSKHLLEKLRNWPKPENMVKLKSFLGLTTHLSEYIENEKRLIISLDALQVDGRKRLIWTAEAEADFDRLRNAIADSLRLAPPIYGDDRCVFVLATDASKYALGAVLWQWQPDYHGKMHRRLVSFASRVMSSSECKFGVSETEALACIFGLEKYRRFIHNHPIILETDHSALRDCFVSGRSNSSRLSRWLLIIQEFNLVDVQYIKGNTNVAADALSRQPVDRNAYEKLAKEEQLFADRLFIQYLFVEDTDRSALAPSINQDVLPRYKDEIEYASLIMGHMLIANEEQFRQAQLDDPTYGPILRYLDSPATHNDVSSDEIKEQAKHYLVIGGRLFRLASPRQRIVVPLSLQKLVLHECHGSLTGGHLSVVPMYQRMKLSYYWVNMHAAIVDFVGKCESCSTFKEGPRQVVHIPALSFGAVHPFHTVNMDVKGPLPATPSRNEYIITFICVKTHWVEAYAVTNQRMPTVRECIVDVISKHGVPRVIICDQGSVFTSHAFSDLCKQWGISCNPHAPHAHWRSGSVERFHRTIGEILQHYLNAYKDNWDVQLPFALFAYRIAYQHTLRSSPFFQLYGRHPETPDTVSLSLPPLVDEDSRSHDQRFLEATALASRYHPEASKVVQKQIIAPGHIIKVRAATNRATFGERWMGNYKVVQASDDKVSYIGHGGRELVASRNNVRLATPDTPFVRDVDETT